MAEFDQKLEKVSANFFINTNKLETLFQSLNQYENPIDTTSKWKPVKSPYLKNPTNSGTTTEAEGEYRVSNTEKFRAEPPISGGMMMDSIPRKQPTYPTYNAEAGESSSNFTGNTGGEVSHITHPEKRGILDFKDHFRQGLEKKQNSFTPLNNNS